MPSPDTIRFIHFADVHLGYRQYGLRERADDFSRAFGSVVDYCLRERPDFVLVAGDLFDSKSIDPRTYADAETRLTALREARIPVVAVEGNHERWFGRGDRSWLWQLSRQGLLRLLRQHDPESGALTWQPWSRERGFGAYTDLGTVRLFGVEYLGARLAAALPDVALAAAAAPGEGRRLRVGLLHTGVDEELPFGHGGVALADLAPLRAIADYLALGHVHYRFELPEDDPWIFNPGSLEAHNVLEGLLDDAEGGGRARGLFDVHVSLTDPPTFEARFVDQVIERRPFLRLLIAVDAVPTFEALVKRVEVALLERASDAPVKPVVELVLRGHPQFERAQLDQQRLLNLVNEILSPLHARLKLEFRAATDTAGPIRATSRQEIEREVVLALIADSPQHAKNVSELTRTALDLKAAVLEGRPVEELAAIVEGALD